MSLQVWLPLNGNLNNQGLSNVTVTNNGATVSNDGKIGQCYSFDGTDDFLQLNNLDINSKKYLSLSFWVYSNVGNLFGVFTVRRSNTVHLISLTGTGLGFRDTNHSTYTQFNFTQPTANTWTHYAIIYDAGSWFIYKDGAKIHEQIYSDATLSTGFDEIRIGRNQTSSVDTYFNGKINDFRIYDHCLSPKEVKEISQGLVLHYKLDDPEILKSKYSTITWNQLVQNGDFSNGTTGWFTSSGTISAANNIITWSPADNKVHFNLNRPVAFVNNHKHYVSFEIKGDVDNLVNAALGEVAGGGSFVNKNYNSTGFTKISGISNPTSASLFNLYIRPNQLGRDNYKAYLKNIQVFDLTQMFGAGNEPTVEEFEMMFPLPYYSYNAGTQMTLDYKTVYDCSGYNNNGTITGSLSANSNTPRYEYSTYITDGRTNYIKSPTIYMSGDAITVNIWVKSSNTSPYGSFHIPLATDGNVEISIGATGYFRGGLYVNGTRYVKDTTGVNVLDGKWHMLSMTYDGTTIKRYVDGVLNNSTSISGTLNGTAKQYYLGKYGANNTYGSREMYTSDVRLYTTALSDQDILDLYNTSAYVDNQQNLHCFEFVEDDSVAPEITKTGIVETQEFIENTETELYEDKIEANQLIEQ